MNYLKMEIDLTVSDDNASSGSLPGADFLLNSIKTAPEVKTFSVESDEIVVTSASDGNNNLSDHHDVYEYNDFQPDYPISNFHSHSISSSDESAKEETVLDKAICISSTSTTEPNSDIELPEISFASRLNGERLTSCKTNITAKNLNNVGSELLSSTNSSFVQKQPVESKRRKLSPEEKAKKLADLELKRQLKAAQQDEKRKKKEAEEEGKRARQAAKSEKTLKKEREKLLKKIESDNHKNAKPDQSIKLLKTMIDSRLLELPVGSVLLQLLQTANIQYQTCVQPVPYCVTWRREVIETNVEDDLQVKTNKQDRDEEEIMIYIPLEKFISFVEAFKKSGFENCTDETLIYHAAVVKTCFPQKAITFVVEGTADYFRSQKKKAQRRFRSAVLQDDNSGNLAPAKTKRKNKSNDQENNSFISEIDVEECLVALQIQEHCNMHMVDSAADVASTIVSFTKAIAAAPYRRERDQNSYLRVCISDKGVKVKDSGVGLLLLWQQQIEMFNLVSCDVAQAIAAKYPSPSALLEAYRRCNSVKDNEKLLQHIVVRRDAGPFAKTRRVGPELSRKIFLHFTTANPYLNLNST